MQKPLESVFDDLRRDGYFAATDWWCCVVCGMDALRARRSTHPAEFERGWVFYTEQDGIDLVERGETEIRFGSAGDEEATCALGEVFRRRFRGAGYDVDWSGDPRETLHLRGVRAESIPVSTRRLVERPAAAPSSPEDHARAISLLERARRSIWRGHLAQSLALLEGVPELPDVPRRMRPFEEACEDARWIREAWKAGPDLQLDSWREALPDSTVKDLLEEARFGPEERDAESWICYDVSGVGRVAYRPPSGSFEIVGRDAVVGEFPSLEALCNHLAGRRMVEEPDESGLCQRRPLHRVLADVELDRGQVVAVDLYANRMIADEFLAYLARIPTLRALELAETAITDAGLEHLLPLRGLEKLGLADTRVTARGWRAVSRHFPDVVESPFAR